MIGEVLVGRNSAFLLDACGNLIKRTTTGPAQALIPFAAEIVSSASDLEHPLAWTITPAAVIERIRFLPGTLTVGTELETVIKTDTLPTSSFPFVQATEFDDAAEATEQAISMWEAAGSTDPLRSQIEEALLASGVHRIPRIKSFNPAIHIKAAQAGSFEVISDGWMSCMKVYRKSVVRTN